jgi:hydrogenase maturation protein HypF
LRNVRHVESIPHLMRRVRVIVNGAVQGVGFRPFVYRLATELELTGWVLNSSEGLVIEAEGDGRTLEIFLRRLEVERPVNSIIRKMDWAYLAPAGFTAFEIRHSDEMGNKSVQVLPDLAICAECLKEIIEPGNRRHLYPFTNCTSCGPRFSIVESLPYDRANTSMKQFKMCEACQREYEDPASRRFHTQPNACHTCGPHLELWDKRGNSVDSKEGSLFQAARAIEKGFIVAVKGLGGFQLIVDARNDGAVRELRKRKHREEKPFAVMFPSVESVMVECDVSEEERKLLLSPASPIVLIKRKGKLGFSRISSLVAPENPFLGVMIPSTPLHALLLDELNFPIVATSGNLSEEPICIDEKEAVERLHDIADFFLIHNRPIVRAMDDSVVKLIMGRPLLLRGGRGYAPIVVQMEKEIPQVLAVGGHLKNTIAVSAGNSVIVSQHIGDLDSSPSYDAFQKAETSLKELYEVNPEAVACDAHPDYFSSHQALQFGVPVIKVQHHHAHIVSCMAEHGLKNRVLGISWDGSGYGPDGTVWGGEFLLATRSEFTRVGRLRTFPLPGGEKSVKEPRRTALGLLYGMLGEKVFERSYLIPVWAFSESELRILRSMLKRRVNTPITSSVGRLFDAVASIVGIKQRMTFEGQAAMALEFSVDPKEKTEKDLLEVDWEPMILEVLLDVERHVPVGRISSRFHNTLVEINVAVAEMLNEEQVVLSGGCFQNRILLERTVNRLRQEGFDVYWPQRIPPNDGGLALGQAVVAALQVRSGQGELSCV